LLIVLLQLTYKTFLDANSNTVLDAVKIDQQGSIITIGTYKVGSDHSKSCSLSEFSNYQLSYPYLTFCKGNAEIFIYNLHHAHEQLVMPISKD